jgi:ATP-dependent RNA helicase DDX10/DBP4
LFFLDSERPPKKKKLKINVHRPVRTRVKYDDEGNIIPPLASVAEKVASEAVVDKDKSMFMFYFNCA